MKNQDKAKMAMKKQNKPKSKLDSLMSEQKRLVNERNFSKVHMSDKAISKFEPWDRTLSKMARISDSVNLGKNTKLIKKELVNIKPSKSITAKLSSDNTKVSKPIVKKIVKSQILVKKKQ
jgi:hypothetical protein